MEKIAIIGLSCLFPDAKTPAEFWQNIFQGKDSISDISIEEMGIEPQIFYDPTKGIVDKFYSLKGAFIRNFKFDASGYKLPAEFLEKLDNTFKWSLYSAKEALSNAGYLANEQALAKCGVILGALSLPTKYSNPVFSPIYQQVIATAVGELLQQPEFNLPAISASVKASNYNAMISGLPSAIIAQSLGLSNIHFCVDAACSSPQYAIKLASHYLWTHKADLMLAGGISSSDPLFLRMLFSGIQAYPEDNDISRPFDKSSRGMMTAEGVTMFVLKRYSDAVRDGDKIYATILGNGLSNDGKGKHLLSPSSKGQILAFERAYQEAQIHPQEIDYMECHATGTLLGDTTEFHSIDTFFGQHQAKPLVGAVKANVGHLLVAAGGVSLIKVLLSMSEGVIPATINIKKPINTSNNVISPEKIVIKNTPWLNKSPVKRAAISAFGFGGTNAHMILEKSTIEEQSPAKEPLKPAKVAIVGMDAYFGGCDGLDAFERSIYDGTQQFIDLPENRWSGIENQEDLLKDYGLLTGKAPQGAYIKNFEIDAIASKIPPNELDKLNPQQLLLLKVADRALKDASIKPASNTAVIIAAETEFSVHQLQQRWNLSWQIKDGLNAGEINLPPEKIAELESIVKDGIHHPVELSEFVSYISNIMASRISSLWDFNAPTFTITSGENSTFKALEIAQHLLATGEADAVLVGAVDLASGVENVLLRSQTAAINTGVNTLSFDQKANGWIPGEGAGAIVLKQHEIAQQDKSRIYAVIDAIAFGENYKTANDLNNSLTAPVAETVTQVSQKALQLANITPQEVTYVEVYGSGIHQEDEAEINGLIKAYPTQDNTLNCAIGSVKANIGHTYVASGIASLIKTALCLYHKYIPATPKWSGVKNEEIWQNSSFYVATESRPWLLSKNFDKRVAAINGIGMDGTYAHLILSDEGQEEERSNTYLQQMPLYLFPIVADSRSDLLGKLETLRSTIKNSHSLAASASLMFAEFKKHPEAKYTISILGRSTKELTREIESAIKGINNAFERAEEWQTPTGSYFTANPLGKVGEIAYVYPAAINAYVGIGQNLGRLFPQIHNDVIIKSLYQVVDDIEKLLYPRSLNKLTTRQKETLEKQLLDNSLAMFESEVCFARLFTTTLRDCFQVKPKFAFGYSLGETSMIAAQGVWQNFDEGIKKFHSSPLFGSRVSGQKNALREYWGLPSAQELDDKLIWSTFVLMAPPEQVSKAIQNESRVYLTQISTPEEVVIAGEPTACQRVIRALGCNAFSAPFNHLIHCEPMRSEYNELVRVNSFDSQSDSDVIFYSSAEYAPIQLNTEAIANSIAKCLTTPLDFPRLVNKVYEDGARIFIEAGAGAVCSRWIDKILSDKEHVTVTLNRRGVDDHTSIIKALAKLTSHRVALDLSPLYISLDEMTHKSKPSMKTITLGGKNIRDSILSEENKKLFQDIVEKLTTTVPNKEKSINNTQAQHILHEDIVREEQLMHELLPLVDISHKDIDAVKIQSLSENQTLITNETIMENPIEQTHEYKNSPQSITTISQIAPPIINQTSLKDFRQLNYQELMKNSSEFIKAHSDFLEARQDSSKQMSEIILLQFICAQELLKE